MRIIAVEGPQVGDWRSTTPEALPQMLRPPRADSAWQVTVSLFFELLGWGTR